MATFPRVSATAVLNICPSDLDVQFAIDAAVSLMTEVYATTTLTPALAEAIQLQLAAHFVAVADPRTKVENYAGARFQYETGTEGEGLKSTRYGRAAIALDPTGDLAKSGMKTTRFDVFAWRQP